MKEILLHFSTVNLISHLMQIGIIFFKEVTCKLSLPQHPALLLNTVILAQVVRKSEMAENNSKMSLIFYMPEKTITEGTRELWDQTVADSWDRFEV